MILQEPLSLEKPLFQWSGKGLGIEGFSSLPGTSQLNKYRPKPQGDCFATLAVT